VSIPWDGVGGFYLDYDRMLDDFGIRLALFGLDMHSVIDIGI
jgi:hypothetical protein